MDKQAFPRMVRVRQNFVRDRVEDVPATVQAELEKLGHAIKPGMTVGITAGSRGIQNILTILEVAVRFVKGKGATPVLLAAMGSHGGGSESGQKEVLDSLGITEERLGAKVITCAKGREVGTTDGGWKVFMLESAFEVDAIMPINRVKTHTSFKGTVESGLAKKLVVGLGGPPGATQFHAVGKSERLSPLLEEVAGAIIAQMPVIGGLAIIENAYEETARIEGVLGENIIERERELLAYSKTLMPSLPVEHIDALVVEEMGKNYSGTGLDTNIVGRLRIQGGTEPASPVIRYISVLDLSEESHGNATGIGLADFTTQKLVDKIDRKATYLNCLTTTFVARAFLPLFLDTEEETLTTMMHCVRNTPLESLRMVFVPNTLFLTDCYVSEGLLSELEGNERYEIVGSPQDVTFDSQGNLELRLSTH
ncbi:hypothetical protein SAMN02745704_00147 [Paucidesulfovibrio gracilis DSM 16080]|uniref:LarA-like N-terminal domain-containing protein n=1 Tax=Paucidesulfovibrio gracilis DSM 16080 TaxID=1121449 RepID=A0A1T4W2F1_9BACT|nr:DUF362 domain-containing protein [Paucidesulfovibrio gracilis]SKA71474.1 hypothetical protein SAMN02745704_00147 [Paucidesulfovibrio gracilis DSM 16080]